MANWRVLVRGLALMVALLLPMAVQPATALAHPHVWIRYHTAVLYEAGGFTGVRHTWTFDEFYTASVTQGLDIDRDGRFSQDELTELAADFMTTLNDFGFFTTAEQGSETVKIGDPTEYWLDVQNDILTLHFTLPFRSPVGAGASNLEISVFDPTVFIAFEPEGTELFTLSAEAPGNCHIGLQTDSLGWDAPSMSALFPEQIDGPGISAMNSILVTCGRG